MSSSPEGVNVNDQLLEAAARRLLDGGLVAFPTETVYGLGADAENAEAIARIYAAKGRPSNHPVIVHLPPDADIAYWAAQVPPQARLLMEAFWPGPLTLILPKAAHIPGAVTGGQDTIGLRCPSHPVAQALLSRFARLKGGQGGVAAPSANLFGQVSPTRAEHVRAEFPALDEGQLLILEGGASQVGIESTILDLSRLDKKVGPVILRPGHITAAQIAQVLDVDVTEAFSAASKQESAASGGHATGAPALPTPRVSGSLKAHYAPRTPLRLVPADLLVSSVRNALLEDGRVACVVSEETQNLISDTTHRVDLYVAPADPVAYARELYALLRRLDQGEYACLVFEQPPRSAAWQAVSDRLGRAAAAFANPR